MKITITFDLRDYVGLLLGARPYGFVSKEQADEIKAVDGDEAITVVENNPLTHGFHCEPLGECAAGVYRLWWKKDWLLCDNKRKLAQQTIEAAHKEYRMKIDLVVESFVRNKISREMAVQMVESMPRDILQTLYDNEVKQQSGEPEGRATVV